MVPIFQQGDLDIACVAGVSVRFRSKERGTTVRDRAKNGATKRARRGWGRKEGNACRQAPRFWKPPTVDLACHAWVHAQTFDAVISSHNWPIKCLSFRGAETNLGGACVKPKYIYFFVFWNAWTALMVKSQWIRTINAGQSSARQNGLPFSPRHRQLECSCKSILEQS